MTTNGTTSETAFLFYNTYPEFFQILQMAEIFNDCDAIFGQIKCLNELIMFQSFNLLDAILRHIQIRQIDQFIQVIEFHNTIRLQRQQL